MIINTIMDKGTQELAGKDNLHSYTRDKNVL